MKTTKFLHTLFTLGALTLTGAFTACNKDDKNTNLPRSIAYGPEVSVGNGKARSFIKLDDSGTPTSIGFTLSKAALEGLPHEDKTFILALPSEKSSTPYDNISLDWSSHGHQDPGKIYDKPHFDMHFYMISPAERAAIKHPSEEMERVPEAKFMPATYFSPPGEGVPQMGKHWGDVTAPELKGKPFTTTFVYGTYDGEVIFHEPMIVRDWLLTEPDTVMAIAQPQAFQRSSLYPAKYAVEFDESKQQYIISFLELSAKQK